MNNTSPAKVINTSNDRVAVVTINRPEVRNAIDAETTHLLEEAFDAIEQSDEVKATVVIGAGELAFSAGMDLKAFAKNGPRGMYTKGGGFAGMTRRQFTKPVIAAVNGSALGGGLEIALACDLMVAAPSATFGLPECKRGLIAGAGGLVRLPRRVPLGVALQMAMTGDAIDAETALAYGLVNALYPAETLLEKAIDLADSISRNAPLSVSWSRKVIFDSIDMTEQDAWSSSDAALREILKSDDVKEGPRAFAEGRNPVWRGQ